MHRIRRDMLDNGEEVDVRFEPIVFGRGGEPHYRVEVKVSSLQEVRNLHRDGKLVGVRMIGKPPGKVVQRSIIGPEEIIDFE